MTLRGARVKLEFGRFTRSQGRSASGCPTCLRKLISLVFGNGVQFTVATGFITSETALAANRHGEWLTIAEGGASIQTPFEALKSKLVHPTRFLARMAGAKCSLRNP